MALCAFMVVSAGQKASADQFCFDTFNTTNFGQLGSGTVDVTGGGSNGTPVTITWNLPSGYALFEFGFSTTLTGTNQAVPGTAISSITGPGTFTLGAVPFGQFDGFGDVVYELRASNASQALQTGTITITPLSNVTLFPSNFEVPSSGGGSGIADFVARVTPPSTVNNGQTIVAGANVCIPEPPSLVLSGLGLGALGLAFGLRRRLK